MTPSVPAGLCAACVHHRVIRSRRGSSFLLCALSRTDPRFARYPPLPVLACDGFVRGSPPASAPDVPEEQ
jgi:hypothetical protein